MTLFPRSPFFLLAFLSVFSAHAQNQREVDSLEIALQSATNDTTRMNAMFHLGHAWLHSDPGKTLWYAKQLDSLSSNIKSATGTAMAHNLKGVHYTAIGDYTKAMDNLMKALRIYDEKNDRRRLTTVCTDLGNVLFYQGNVKGSRPYYERALKLSEELKFKEGMAHAYHNLAGCFYMEKKLDSCLLFLNRHIQMCKELGDAAEVNNALANMGALYASMGKKQEAMACMDSALAYCLRIRDLRGVCRSLMDKASLIYDMGQEEEALELYKAAIDTATRVKDNITRQEIYKSLALSYADKKKFGDAYEFLLKSYLLKDSLNSQDINKQIAEMNTKYQTEKKDKELLRTSAEAKQRATERNGFIAGFVLLAILSVFVFRNYREKKKANAELARQKAIIEEKNKDITASISYASRIQGASLPAPEELAQLFPSSFIFFRPRDIVSGDFYWFARKGDQVLMAAADCTGHGVPGALMSMIGSSFLNQIVNEKTITSPSQVLNELNVQVMRALKQDNAESQNRDGMDISFIEIGSGAGLARFAGANRPLYHLRNGELNEIKGDKLPIGGYYSGKRVFTQKEITLQPGDSLYLFSDGYADQFGGEKGKKMMTRHFKDLLRSIQSFSMKEQGRILEEKLDQWRASYEQVDDILVIGIKI